MINVSDSNNFVLFLVNRVNFVYTELPVGEYTETNFINMFNQTMDKSGNYYDSNGNSISKNFTINLSKYNDDYYTINISSGVFTPLYTARGIYSIDFFGNMPFYFYDNKLKHASTIKFPNYLLNSVPLMDPDYSTVYVIDKETNEEKVIRLSESSIIESVTLIDFCKRFSNYISFAGMNQDNYYSFSTTNRSLLTLSTVFSNFQKLKRLILPEYLAYFFGINDNIKNFSVDFVKLTNPVATPQAITSNFIDDYKEYDKTNYYFVALSSSGSSRIPLVKPKKSLIATIHRNMRNPLTKVKLIGTAVNSSGIYVPINRLFAVNKPIAITSTLYNTIKSLHYNSKYTMNNYQVLYNSDTSCSVDLKEDSGSKLIFNNYADIYQTNTSIFNVYTNCYHCAIYGCAAISKNKNRVNCDNSTKTCEGFSNNNRVFTEFYVILGSLLIVSILIKL